jgi:hypothetical protein
VSALRASVAIAVLGLLAAAPSAAQGLGDLAARERSKRAAEAKKKKEPPKSFTNEDLEAGRPPGTKPAEGAGEAPAPTDVGPPGGAPVEAPLERERSLLDAVTAAQQRLTGAETRVRALSEKLNPMSVSYIYGAGGSNDANEELRVRAELTQAEADLQAARQALATANQNLQAARGPRPQGPLVEH